MGIARLQPTVSLSTAESECIATTDCVKLLMHLRLLLRELGRKQEKPTVVYEDNQAAVKLVEMPEQSKKAKHYQMKLQFLMHMSMRSAFPTLRRFGTKNDGISGFDSHIRPA